MQCMLLLGTNHWHPLIIGNFKVGSGIQQCKCNVAIPLIISYSWTYSNSALFHVMLGSAPIHYNTSVLTGVMNTPSKSATSDFSPQIFSFLYRCPKSLDDCFTSTIFSLPTIIFSLSALPNDLRWVQNMTTESPEKACTCLREISALPCLALA